MIKAVALTKQFHSPVTKDGAFKGIRTFFSRKMIVKEAVSDVSFEIAPGEFVGYIGPNGAGKSTTIKMLSGILHPTSGSVTIDGLSPHRDRRKVARKLGVLFGQRTQLWWDLPTRDSYAILAAMYGVHPNDAAKKLDQLNELLQLDHFLDTPVRKLSLGQRMRADIAAALLHSPGILFLDEPTIGLDMNAKRSIREFLRLINEELGTTVLLTTHDMDDIEKLCSRVMVLGGGKLSFDGSIAELRSKIGLPTLLTVTYSKPLAASSLTDPSLSDLLLEEGMRLQEMSGSQLTVEFNRQQHSAAKALRILEVYGDIEDVHMNEPDFEDIIQRMY